MEVGIRLLKFDWFEMVILEYFKNFLGVSGIGFKICLKFFNIFCVVCDSCK